MSRIGRALRWLTSAPLARISSVAVLIVLLGACCLRGTEREISGAPVVNSQGHLIGVVSMTDIGRNLAEPSEFASSRRSEFYDMAGDDTLEELLIEERSVAVRDVMTPVVHHASASAPIAEAARIMVEQHIHRLVVTQAREPVGIITSMDLCASSPNSE